MCQNSPTENKNGRVVSFKWLDSHSWPRLPYCSGFWITPNWTCHTQ